MKPLRQALKEGWEHSPWKLAHDVGQTAAIFITMALQAVTTVLIVLHLLGHLGHVR